MFKLFKRKDVTLGKGSVEQFTIIECKWLFSIILYRWNTIDQIRFHTHAFNAVAFLLKGGYTEEVLENGLVHINTVDNLFVPRFLPKNYCHAIKRAIPNTRTLVITGPWQKTWQEYFPDTKKWVTYTWGRVKTNETKVDMPCLYE